MKAMNNHFAASPPPPFAICNLRRINRGKLLAGFVLDVFGVGAIEAELFGPRVDGTFWCDARSVKDGGGEYRRSVVLDRKFREAVCAQAVALYRKAGAA
jgi:hypothetical protein